MNQINLPQPKPGAPQRPSDRRPLWWAFITALTATAALGVVVPRLVGHGNAHASVTPSAVATPTSASSSATWDRTVPAASDVFVNPESGAVVSASPPTF
jgi:hypothetical protein